LRSWQSKKKQAAEKEQEIDFLRIEEKPKCIEDYVDREIAVAWKRVQEAETANSQEQEDRCNAEMVELTTTKLEKRFGQMLTAMRYWLSELHISDNEEDVENQDDDDGDTELGKLSEDDEPGLVMGILSILVHYWMEGFRQKLMKPEELTLLGWGDAADNFGKRDRTYRKAELRVAVVF